MINNYLFSIISICIFQVWTTGTMGELSPVHTQSLLYYTFLEPAMFTVNKPAPVQSRESMDFWPLYQYIKSPKNRKQEPALTINMKSLRMVFSLLREFILIGVHCFQVVKIDGRVIGEGEVGPVTRKLQSAYKKLTDDLGVSIPTYQEL